MPIEVLLSFNRLKQLGLDAKAISMALLESKELTLSADGAKVRRNTPLPATDDSRACMVYLKGFPEDVTLEQLEAWGPNGDVARYVLRRVPGKADKQKPSIFMEMKTPEAAAALVKQHAETALEFAGKALEEVKLRDEYLREKREQRAAAGGASGGRRGKIREEDLMAGFKRDKVDGAIIKLTGLPEDADGDAMDAALRELADVRFVELIEDQPDAAIVRTTSAAAGQLLMRACEELVALSAASKPLDAEAEEGKTTEEAKRTARKALAEACKGTIPKAEVLAGAEADAYWDRVFALQARKYRARVLQRMKKTERDVIPAGTPEPSVEAAATAGAAEAGERPAKRTADDVAAEDAEAASAAPSSSAAAAAAAAAPAAAEDAEAAAKRVKTE